MSEHHDHGASHANEKTLAYALALTTTFLIAEIVGGLLTRSLALLSDAAHMMTDAAGLAIALVAIRIARRPADRKRTFGYYRFEILAAAFNAVLLIFVAAYILFEGYKRIASPPTIQSTGMLVVAIIGLIVNFISMRLLQGGSDKSLNVKGAYLEVWSDLIGSVGVIAAALTIRFTGWAWVDAVVAVAIGLWVLPRTWVLLKESLNILLEGIPEGVDIDAIEQAVLKIPGVTGVHDLHIWALSSGKISLTTHLTIASEGEHQSILNAVSSILASTFNIHHTTVQIENAECAVPETVDHFSEAHDHESEGHP